MKNHSMLVRIVLLAAILLLVAGFVLPAQTVKALAGESFARWLLAGSSGGISTGGGYTLSASLGQSFTGPSAGGSYNFNAGYHSGLPQPPTAVLVALFDANSSAAQVTVTWQTGQETTITAFNVYRADGETDSRTLLTTLPAQFGQGGEYIFTDSTHTSGCYWLEALHGEGAATFGPVCITSQAWKLFLPVIK